MLPYSADIHKPAFESCSSYGIQNYLPVVHLLSGITCASKVIKTDFSVTLTLKLRY